MSFFTNAARGVVAALLVLMLAGCASTGPHVEATSATGYQRLLTAEIFSVKYDAAGQVLTVVQRDGRSVYDYQDVPQDVFEAWMASDDKDAYYTKTIKDGFKSKKFDF